MKIIKVGVLIGSLRKESYSKKAAAVLMEMADSSLDMRILEIENLAFYNEDLETDDPPKAWVAFRRAAMEADAFLIVTPEYNRSVPAVLKNALDVGSRPYNENVFNAKPAAVISVSPGAIGGFGANHHIRQTLMSLNVLTMQQPEAYIGKIDTLLDEEGYLKNQTTADYFHKIMKSMTAWFVRNLK